MSMAFDLAPHNDARANADRILAKLSDGSMPCDGTLAGADGRCMCACRRLTSSPGIETGV